MEKMIELETTDKFVKIYMEVSQKALQFVLKTMNDKCYVVSDSMMRARAMLIKQKEPEPTRTICVCSIEGAAGLFLKVNNVGGYAEIDEIDSNTFELLYIVESNTFMVKWSFAYTNEFNYIDIHKFLNK